MVCARRCETTRRGPRISGGVVKFGARNSGRRISASCDQNRAVGQKRGGEKKARRCKISSGGPSIRNGIVNLRTRERGVSGLVTPAYH